MIPVSDMKSWAMTYANRATIRREGQEDAAGAAMLRALEYLRDAPDASPAYVRTIIKHAVLDYVDYLYHRNFCELFDSLPAPDSMGATDARIQADIVLAGIRGYAREAFRLKAQGLSDDETAKRLGVTRPSIKNRMERARVQLRSRYPEMVTP